MFTPPRERTGATAGEGSRGSLQGNRDARHFNTLYARINKKNKKQATKKAPKVISGAFSKP